MATRRIFHFFSEDRRDPHVEHVIKYEIDTDGREGVLHFDGHFYVKNEEFPIRTFYCTNVVQRDDPVDASGNMVAVATPSYKYLEERFYEIEIYDRFKGEETSQYGETEDEDGSMMRICLYPTHKQKIFFRVVKEFADVNAMFARITQLREGAEAAATA